MFEMLIASGLCFYVNAPGQIIELADPCVGAAAPVSQTSSTPDEAAFLQAYRRRFPHSRFTDAEALFSGHVSCGGGAAISSSGTVTERFTPQNEADIAMLMQHWEASHAAALSHLCPGLLNLQGLPGAGLEP